ncbi:hypothetical protein GCM10023156_13430 [Novipirellula rosea]|uniref:Uncharacterized protein n=1 Tax=Novipirellula rosea TaxID=1031540 RepID=A0ABP8ME74_9BACT
MAKTAQFFCHLSTNFVGAEVTAVGRKKDSPQYPTSILKFQQTSLAPDDRLEAYPTHGLAPDDRLEAYPTLGNDGMLDVAVDVG